jgi:adenine deaminase
MKIFLLTTLLFCSTSLHARDNNAKIDYEKFIKDRVRSVGESLCKANFTTTNCSNLNVTLKEIYSDDVHITHKAIIKVRHDPNGPASATMTFIINDGRITAVKDQCHLCG